MDLGLTVLVATEEFGVAWIVNQGELLHMATLDRWKAAIGRSRVRRLPEPWKLPSLSNITTEDSDVAAIVGTAWIRRVAEARWPGVWSRLRMSFPKRWVVAAEARDHEPSGVQVPGSIRQALRIWTNNNGHGDRHG
ncbi:hypothetical protein [Burkholderia territorii]|uniref:hypothetical protein n=1 Tax=Burkholderia territorii TaxID=1503055 RepID=UPI0012D9D3A5|nr:hypothetical protein [Burkholderia territorii]